MKEKMQEFSTAFAALDKKFEEIKADGYAKPEDQANAIENIGYMIRNLSNQVSYLYNDMYNWQSKHQKGHPPALASATNVEKYLKACGMENDYEVQKPTIWVNALYFYF